MLTYLLRADLLGDGLNLIVAYIQFRHLIGFPPILDQLQFLKSADFHREDFKALSL